jgi:hypothetical protein
MNEEIMKKYKAMEHLIFAPAPCSRLAAVLKFIFNPRKRKKKIKLIHALYYKVL